MTTVAKRILAPVRALALLLVSAVVASSAPFKTRQEVFWFGTAVTNRAIIKQERADECRVAGEDLPAEADLSGNWGFSSEGFQLSLRFEKPVFLTGEPIIATLIVRNVSGGARADSIALPDRTDFVVTNEKDEPLKRIDIFRPNPTEKEERLRATFKGFSLQLEADEQWKYKMVLTDIFDLRRPGTYYVRAMRRIWKPDKTAGEILSGTASIKIIEGSVASGSGKPGGLNPSLAPTPAREASGNSSTISGATGQTAGPPIELTGARATTQPTDSTADTPRENPQSDSSPASNEAGGTHLGVASGAVRIGASVLVLVVVAALGFILIRRARGRS